MSPHAEKSNPFSDKKKNYLRYKEWALY